MCRSWPSASRTMPTASMPPKVKMKKYDGIAKSVPDSRMPRRFASVSRATNANGHLNAKIGQLGNGGRDRGHTGRRRHGNGQDVVDDQGRAGEQAGIDADVRLRHVVGAAAARIGLDELDVGSRDDRRQGRDRDRDGDRVVKGARPGQDEDEEDFLRRVGRRRKVVGGEDGERLHLAQAFVRQVRRGDRRAQDDVTDAGKRPADAASSVLSPRPWPRTRPHRHVAGAGHGRASGGCGESRAGCPGRSRVAPAPWVAPALLPRRRGRRTRVRVSSVSAGGGGGAPNRFLPRTHLQ